LRSPAPKSGLPTDEEDDLIIKHDGSSSSDADGQKKSAYVSLFRGEESLAATKKANNKDLRAKSALMQDSMVHTKKFYPDSSLKKKNSLRKRTRHKRFSLYKHDKFK